LSNGTVPCEGQGGGGEGGGFPRIPIPGFGACNNGIGREICPIGPVVVE